MRKIMPVMRNNNDVTIRVYLVQFPLILRVYGLGLLQTNRTAQQWHKAFVHVPNGQITTRRFALKHQSCRLKKQQNKRFWVRKAQRQNSPSAANGGLTRSICGVSLQTPTSVSFIDSNLPPSFLVCFFFKLPWATNSIFCLISSFLAS